MRNTSSIICLLSVVCCLWSVPVLAGERIVSLNACTDELLLQLAEPAQIAGVTRFHHSPKSEALLNSNPQILKLTRDLEQIHATQPSVVLAGPFSDPLLIEQLKRAHIPVSNVEVPRDWNELIGVSEQVANLAGHPEKFKIFRETILELQKLSQSSPWLGKTAVFWSAAGHVSGRGTFENTILSTLGMKNKADFEGYAFLSVEKLILLHPDVIVVTQNPEHKDSWSHDTLFHPALRFALPDLEYVVMPESSTSCASAYTVESLEKLLSSPEMQDARYAL